jgi:glycosyltransferase involved in cell wall biosynthesis
MTEKIKILTLGDMPLSPSGVGTQSRYIFEALLKTGRYKISSFGGAIKHAEYKPIKTETYGDDWVIYPIDGFGNPELVRSIIRNERPDVLWFMTDPRFFGWLWAIEDEIRPLMPMVYYHVWDNYPYPKFNRPFYLSNDVVVTISKVTAEIVKNVTPEVEHHYLPHAVDGDIFKHYGDTKCDKMRKDNFKHWENDKFLFFWNNRNARRKMSGSLVWWFKEFLDKVGHNKACLLMHTEPKDPNGPNLEALIQELGLTNGEVMFSTNKLSPPDLAALYNMADCTINISDAEGFGLATLESLSCETPIITTMTGGLQEQVTDGKNWFGIGIEPASKAVIGSQEVPFIYEDRICKEDFLNAMTKMYEMHKKERRELGKKGRQHVMKNYNFKNFEKQWIELIDQIHEKYGSWDTRKHYVPWTFKEVA